MKVLFIGIIGFLFSLKSFAQEFVSPGPYRYDSRSGKCKNKRGRVGYNKYNAKVLFGSPTIQLQDMGQMGKWEIKINNNRNAECVNFPKNLDIEEYLAKIKNNSGDFYYWNLKGARLNNFIATTIFKFNYARAEGADFSKSFWSHYSTVNAFADKFTKAGGKGIGCALLFKKTRLGCALDVDLHGTSWKYKWKSFHKKFPNFWKVWNKKMYQSGR